MLEESKSFTSEFTQVLLVSHKFLEINNLFVKKHTGDLSGKFTHYRLNAGVDRVTNHLLLFYEALSCDDVLDIDFRKGNLSIVRFSTLRLEGLGDRLLSRLVFTILALVLSTTTLLITTTLGLSLVGGSTHQMHLQIVQSTLN